MFYNWTGMLGRKLHILEMAVVDEAVDAITNV